MSRSKRQRVLITLILLLTAVGFNAFGNEVDSTLRPASPQILGQGGSVVATASGYDALFSNPAGFASSEDSLTFYSSSFWLYANPLQAFLALVDSDSSALQNFMEDQITSGGFGFGSADGLGYVVKGFGLGGVITIDTYAWGATTGTADGDLAVTLAFIGGYAHPFKINGAIVKIGADIRPMIRVLAPVDHQTMLDFINALQSPANPLATLNNKNALHGSAIAIDLGVIVESGGLRWGLAVRDFLGTRFRYSQDPFGDMLVSLRETGRFPTGGVAVNDYVVPMDISSGFAYDFDFPSSKVLTDLVVHWSLSDIVTVAMEERPPASVMHAGAELVLYSRWKLRAGFNQGYLTFGTGIRVWLLDFNLAFFTREMGVLSTNRANPGLTLEVAFRRQGKRSGRQSADDLQTDSSAEPDLSQ